MLVLPRHTYPFPPLIDRRAADAGSVPLRVDHLIMLACALATCRPACSSALPHPLRAGAARHHRQSGRGASGRHRCRNRRSRRLRRCIRDRRHRRLPGARHRPADHPDVRHVGDAQGPDRHDDRRARLDSRGDPGRACCSACSEAHSQWYFGPQIRDLVAYLLLFACLVLRPGGLLGEAPTRETDRPPRGHDRWTIISIGVLSNIGVISFVALSAYLLLLTGEISFGQQAFFAIGAYAAGIATALWGWSLTAALVWGAATGAAAAVLVGVPTLRLHGLYFAIATLAFAEMVRLLFELFHYQIFDRRRMGRPRRQRWLPQYPLHFRKRYRAGAIPGC